LKKKKTFHRKMNDAKCAEHKRLSTTHTVEMNENSLQKSQLDDKIKNDLIKQDQNHMMFQDLLSNLEATLKLKDDNIYSTTTTTTTTTNAVYVDFAHFAEFIQNLFDAGETIKLDENSSCLLKRLVKKLKNYQEIDLNNNYGTRVPSISTCSDAVYKSNLKLMEKEILSLRAKLKQTQHDLDRYKLKLKWSSSTQTNDSFWTQSQTSSFCLYSGKSSSPTITSSNNQTSSPVSSLLLSNETGMDMSGDVSGGNDDLTWLDDDFDFLSNLKVDKLIIKIKEQNQIIKEIISMFNSFFEGEF
jgi:hypothetical protein